LCFLAILPRWVRRRQGILIKAEGLGSEENQGLPEARETEIELVPDPTPDFSGINSFIRIQCLCPIQKNLRRFRIERIGDAAIIDRTHGRALGFIKMADTLGAPVVGDDIDIIADSLSIPDVVPFRLSVASGFENCFIGTFRQACPARDTFVRNQ
jgi:hypothetical protein